ncbi:unnamed protein product, partial [marine sediment metagenome]
LYIFERIVDFTHVISLLVLALMGLDSFDKDFLKYSGNAVVIWIFAFKKI